jgi:hypothetical protein
MWGAIEGWVEYGVEELRERKSFSMGGEVLWLSWDG